MSTFTFKYGQLSYEEITAEVEAESEEEAREKLQGLSHGGSGGSIKKAEFVDVHESYEDDATLVNQSGS
jgi:hypothetical protein